MQIFEVKNDTAEILYSPKEDKLCISDFLFLEDDDATIVSQVTDIVITEQQNLNIAKTKFLLCVNSDNILSIYNGHLPSRNSDVGYLDPKEIIGLFKPKTNQLFWGNYLRQPSIDVITDFNIISSGCCIICDRTEQSCSLIKKIMPSFEEAGKTTFIIDTAGSYKDFGFGERLVYGINYKIPLNSFALEYILENDLNDCPIDAKVIIQEIIMELQDYIETTEDKFLPFDLFLQTIVAECKTSQNTGLLVFCNKILKYQQKKIFANDKAEFQILNDINGTAVFDITNTDVKYHSLIYNAICTSIAKETILFANISEEFITQSMVKSMYDKKYVKLVPIISHEDSLVTKIKSYNKNSVIFSPIVRKSSEEPYSNIMKNLTLNDFIIWGESTMFIPLVIILNKEYSKSLNEYREQSIKADRITEDDLDDLDYIRMNYASEEPEYLTEQEEQNQEISSEIINEEPQEVLTDEIPLVQYEEQPSEEISEETLILTQEQTNEDMPQEIPLVQYDGQIQENPEEELNFVQYDEQSLIENSEESGIILQEDEEIQYQNETEQEKPRNSFYGQPMTPQEFRQVESKALQQNVPNANTLPVYEPKETENNSQYFEEGTRVRHAKYGIGTVEKLIKYGRKTLCSVQFDTVGRRLLDPGITELIEI